MLQQKGQPREGPAHAVADGLLSHPQHLADLFLVLAFEEMELDDVAFDGWDAGEQLANAFELGAKTFVCGPGEFNPGPQVHKVGIDI